jgi:unsaturated rhamnogalacturonyl hydrolase
METTVTTPTLSRAARLLSALAALAVLSAPVHADGPYRNPDNKSKDDPAEGSYPVPYKKPVAAEIEASLQRIRAFLEAQTPTRVVHKGSGAEITDFSTPAQDAVVPTTDMDFGLQVYEMGVVHAGMLKAAQATGDKRFSDFTARHFNFFAARLPYFRAQQERFHLDRANSFARFLDPRSLDDAGAMCAAMMRARRATSARTSASRSTSAATGSRIASSACPTAPSRASARRRCRCGPTTCTWGSRRWPNWDA